jgi:hypothetical protein
MHLRQFARLATGQIGRLLVAPMLVLLGGSIALARAGTPPRLEFDVPFTIGCRSLPIRNPALADPEKQLIEIVLPISARLRAGTEKDLKQCLYTLVSPLEPGSLLITDWLPRTELKTEFAKPIQVSQESLAKIGINLSARYIVTASGESGAQLKSGVAYEMLPPQEIVLASGTIQQGHGLFFKLKPSTQTTLEGMKSFSAICAVPRGWRGGCVKLECEAVGFDRALVQKLDREVTSGQAVFYLALYLAGDQEAERLASRMASCEQELFESFLRHPKETRSAYDGSLSWTGRLGKWARFSEKSSFPIPAGTTRSEVALLGQILDNTKSQTNSLDEFPAATQDKVCALRQAALTLQRLSAWGAAPSEHTAGWGNPSTGSAQGSGDARATQSASTRASSRAGATGATLGFAELEAKSVTPAKSAVHRSGGEHLEGSGDHNSPSPTDSRSLGQPLSASQLAATSAKEGTYVLASILGALFTSIVGPLVVDLIRKRMENSRGEGLKMDEGR